MAKKKARKSGARPAPPPARPAAAKPARTEPSPKELARLARERSARRAALRKKALTGGLIVLLLAPLVGYFGWNRVQAARLDDALTAGSCRTDSENDPARPTGQNHVPDPVFTVNPPAGGDHTPAVNGAGVYSAQQAQDGPTVHALEHGYIVLWHQSDLAEDEKARLEQVYEDHERDVLLVERPSLPVPVAATAWGHRLLCQEVEPTVLARFIDEYVNDGPEDVEHP